MSDLGSLTATVAGEVIEPGARGYDAARTPAHRQFAGIRPRAVVRCASTSDVVAAVAFARAAGMHLVPRGGGHCFAGRSSTDGLLLDLGPLDAVTVATDGRAVIGAGARLAQVYDVLHRHGRTLPAGCGPTVGIAGLTLGGGLGLLGRQYGLTCDRLLAATVVLADGRVVDCDQHREPELFWALRGAGGGQFGVVTSFVFETVAEPVASRFELRWPVDVAAPVVAAWQDWAPDAPDDVSATLMIVADDDRANVIVYGCVLRAASPTADVLAGLAGRVGTCPETRIRADLGYAALKASFADLEAGTPATDEVRASRSEFFAAPLPQDAVDDLLDAFLAARTGHRELNFMPMGGAYNRVPGDATAFVHRDERFLVEHVGIGAEAAVWTDRSWTIAHPHASGRVYPNFPDPRLDDWAQAYHGDNYERLVAVKRRYDPQRFFRFAQSVGE